MESVKQDMQLQSRKMEELKNNLQAAEKKLEEVKEKIHQVDEVAGPIKVLILPIHQVEEIAGPINNNFILYFCFVPFVCQGE